VKAPERTVAVFRRDGADYVGTKEGGAGDEKVARREEVTHVQRESKRIKAEKFSEGGGGPQKPYNLNYRCFQAKS